MKKDRFWGALILLLAVTVMLAGCAADDWASYTVYIDRQSQTPLEEALIQAAEHACPLREDVLAAASPEDREALDAEAGAGCLWWYENDDIRTPYAITAAAIDYYADQVEQARKNHVGFWPVMPYADMWYEAKIEPQNDYTTAGKQYHNAYLVSMSLSYDEGSVLPSTDIWLHKNRTVVVTGDGEVLNVFGDGTTEWSE